MYLQICVSLYVFIHICIEREREMDKRCVGIQVRVSRVKQAIFKRICTIFWTSVLPPAISLKDDDRSSISLSKLVYGMVVDKYIYAVEISVSSIKTSVKSIRFAIRYLSLKLGHISSQYFLVLTTYC